MRLERIGYGYSFPTTGGRILLEPGAADLSGGVAAEPVIPGGLEVDSGNRESVSQGSSQANGERNMETVPETSSAGTAATPVNAGSNLVPADPNQQAAATEWQSIRDAGQGLGYQFPATVTNDQQALQYLIQQAQASNYYAQVGQRLAPHATKIQDYFKQQQTPPTPQPAARPAWEPPPFDDRWGSLVTQDPQTGVYVGKPGVSPDIVDKVNEYAEWQDKYKHNPAAVMRDMVRAQAEELFEQRFQERYEQQQREASISNIVRDNTPWLHARDQAGNPVYDQWGRPQPSPIGAAYLRHLGEVKNMGITDPVKQDSLAKRLLQGELALSNYQKTTQQAAAASPGATQAGFRPNTNQLGAGLTPTQQAFTPGATAQAADGLSLQETLRLAFEREGVSDNDFAFTG